MSGVLANTPGFEWAPNEGSHPEARDFASELLETLESLPARKTAPMRRVRRAFFHRLKGAPAGKVFEVAGHILESDEYRWIAYELIRDHPGAFGALNRERLEALGHGMASWRAVDSFARTLAGPAWREGIIPGQVIRHWARSSDRWWRRAALVSTVALNVRSRGGMGDVGRTLAICEMLLDERDDMVVKALSWALRELVPHDREELKKFLSEHDAALAARVKREVRNKLRTGLKNP